MEVIFSFLALSAEMWKQMTLQESTDFWKHKEAEMVPLATGEGVLHPDKFKLDLVVSGNKKGIGRLEPRQKLDHMGEGVGDCHLVKEPLSLNPRPTVVV